ncbi:DUF512 domain-containing protein [Chitinispirillales bacterium ANBcel5]|uniref:DUF512 domain-containing protein n=1 Tax=Cellulosispirillum alkaliphilum TaxID=3039283 RepID=UPI002A57916B|nr:DUF512 domain-containing protein [Chitinispirillales bacterium ANBcel5]
MSLNTVKKCPTQGLKIKRVPKHSFLFSAGLRSGDQIVALNGNSIGDELDFFFFGADSLLTIECVRNGKRKTISVERPPDAFLDVEFYQLPINRCGNRCVFCFIDQMPPGLRKSLYIKDEDFKHSFLNGNYVTLATASEADLERVAQLGLSPLFISVHATDPQVRGAMLRNKKAPPILQQLSFLALHSVSFHTQLVICPGYNDGAVLKQTLSDLLSLGESLLSVAIVPVGLTRFRNEFLSDVNAECAKEIISLVQNVQRLAEGKIFIADELFIRASLPIPPASYYCEYPQIENGVGLVRQFLESWDDLKGTLNDRGKRGVGSSDEKSVLVITSLSAHPYVSQVFNELSELVPHTFNVIPVHNSYFGESVTVAGLLTAKDVIREVKRQLKKDRYDAVYVPDVMFSYAGYTLDGYSSERIEKKVGVTLRVISMLEDCIETGNSMGIHEIETRDGDINGM